MGILGNNSGLAALIQALQQNQQQGGLPQGLMGGGNNSPQFLAPQTQNPLQRVPSQSMPAQMPMGQNLPPDATSTPQGIMGGIQNNPMLQQLLSMQGQQGQNQQGQQNPNAQVENPFSGTNSMTPQNQQMMTNMENGLSPNSPFNASDISNIKNMFANPNAAPAQSQGFYSQLMSLFKRGNNSEPN